MKGGRTSTDKGARTRLASATRQIHVLEASQLLSCVSMVGLCIAHLAILSCASPCLQVRTGAVGGPQARRPPRVPDRGRGGTAGARFCAHQVRGTAHVLLLCTCTVGGSAKKFPPFGCFTFVHGCR